MATESVLIIINFIVTVVVFVWLLNNDEKHWDARKKLKAEYDRLEKTYITLMEARRKDILQRGLLWEEHLDNELKKVLDSKKNVARSIGISTTTLRKAAKGKNVKPGVVSMINKWCRMEKVITKRIRPGVRF